ncbi:hypothetical protein L1889_15655 [Paenalcaligenes niemegkensis]|uniref:hypothetical protein n=1 Tax=Paenalcaligenes niemegkensis TaxID=2895469 RepID=UPI001EE7AA83|nr:hypothetical protein [Paenalcaligenes niemegkensis]MCQ9617927.1 hypothetical protein [Paenalcaligenes niemegkensis]
MEKPSINVPDRHQLYEEVWATPISRLCKQYGLTSYGLRKLCVQLQVPLPRQGHWERIAAGHHAERPDLPVEIIPSPGKSPSASNRRTKRVVKAEIVQEMDAPAPSALPNLPKLPKRLHPVVETLWQLLKGPFDEAIISRKRFDWEQRHPGRDYPDRGAFYLPWQSFCDRGQILADTHRKFAFRVSLPSCERALKLLDVVCREAEGKGYRPSMTEGNARIQLEMDGAYVYLRLTEKREAGTRKKINSWNNSVSHVKTLTPTGLLTMGIGQLGWGETTIGDQSDELLEQQLDAIFKIVASRYERSVKEAAKRKQRDIDFAGAEARRLEHEQLQREARQRAEQELAKRNALIREAEDWKRSCEIRSYLSVLDSRMIEGGVTASDYATWRSWATGVADDLDPSEKRVASPEAPPDQEKGDSV